KAQPLQLLSANLIILSSFLRPIDDLARSLHGCFQLQVVGFVSFFHLSVLFQKIFDTGILMIQAPYFPIIPYFFLLKFSISFLTFSCKELKSPVIFWPLLKKLYISETFKLSTCFCA